MSRSGEGSVSNAKLTPKSMVLDAAYITDPFTKVALQQFVSSSFKNDVDEDVSLEVLACEDLKLQKYAEEDQLKDLKRFISHIHTKSFSFCDTVNIKWI